MKKSLKIVLAGIMLAMTVVFSGCFGGLGGGSEKVKVTASMLVGRWEAPSQMKGAEEGAKLTFVFLTDSCVVDGVCYGQWGYQFDEGEDVREEDLLSDLADGSFHKNGWFGWEADGSDQITAVHMTSVGSAKTPYNWEVKAISSSSMTLIDGNKTYTFTKVKNNN